MMHCTVNSGEKQSCTWGIAGFTTFAQYSLIQIGCVHDPPFDVTISVVGQVPKSMGDGQLSKEICLLIGSAFEYKPPNISHTFLKSVLTFGHLNEKRCDVNAT